MSAIKEKVKALDFIALEKEGQKDTILACECVDLYVCLESRHATLLRKMDESPGRPMSALNKRRQREIIIALGILVAIVVVFSLIGFLS
jgi:hypothetical protein